jgi:hypothetical protein
MSMMMGWLMGEGVRHVYTLDETMHAECALMYEMTMRMQDGDVMEDMTWGKQQRIRQDC